MIAMMDGGDLGIPKQSGKVRDIYDLGEHLLIVATDRISAFDFILPTGIPDKGRILNQLSAYWFQRVAIPHHLISTEIDDLNLALSEDDRQQLAGRISLVRKAKVIPFECVVRGFLFGSAWREYQATGTVCGIQLPQGLVEAGRLPEPIFTPATKAATGHDQNISVDYLAQSLGAELGGQLERTSLSIYRSAAAEAESKGIILADTKFEFGHDQETGELILIDELLTPDSSRYWPLRDYQPGISPPSFDKQFVRDWLINSGWDQSKSPPPPLPAEIVSQTRTKYIQAYEWLSGSAFPEW